MPPRRPIGLKDRLRVLELARQDVTAQQIAQRMGISSVTVKQILAKGLTQCDRCHRMIVGGDPCPLCSLPAGAPLGDRLKVFRAAAGLSQFQFAIQLGIPATRVRRWEKGKVHPAKHEIEMLADALGITVQELTGTQESR